MAKNILIIEDEEGIADTLIYALETENYQVKWVSKALEGLENLEKESYDLVILDVGLPDIDGFEACRRIREKSQIPIFFLTARSEEIDRVIGLEIGADDYITKPFSPREITARIKAHFRRFSLQDPQVNNQLTYGPFSLDEERMLITLNENKLELRRYEFGILKTLISKPGRVYSRAQLMEKIWDEPDMSLERTVDAHIKVIRAQIKKYSDGVDWVVTHRGTGYSLKEK